jgi:hypothetical protein
LKFHLVDFYFLTTFVQYPLRKKSKPPDFCCAKKATQRYEKSDKEAPDVAGNGKIDQAMGLRGRKPFGLLPSGGDFSLGVPVLGGPFAPPVSPAGETAAWGFTEIRTESPGGGGGAWLRIKHPGGIEGEVGAAYTRQLLGWYSAPPFGTSSTKQFKQCTFS